MKLSQRVRRQLATLTLTTVGLSLPGIGWSSVTVSSRPLFLAADINHNLMFLVDDSGSMDWEILAPAVGSAGAVTSGYVFDVGDETGSAYKTGRAMSSGSFYPYSHRRVYLRSSDYNYQYYDPKQTYAPWPSTASRKYLNSSLTSAKVDPGLESSLTVNLTSNRYVSRDSTETYYPAQFFVTTTSGYVEQRDSRGRLTGTLYCNNITANWHTNWYTYPTRYTFYGAAEALAPDGKCLDRVEIRSTNATEIKNITGRTYEQEAQNFANWFSYYRRRHQAIRGALADAVKDVSFMRVGVFWLHNRRAMASYMYDSDTQMDKLLDEHYNRFDSGNWAGGGTPLRTALQHAGREYSKEAVRGTLECRKNYTLVFTDGYANSHPSSTDAGGADNTAPKPFGTDGYDNTLADIAWYYYQGLRSSGKVIPGGAMRLSGDCGTPAEKPWMDCNKDYHMNTYTIALGMIGERYAGKTHFKVMDAHTSHPDWTKVTGTNGTDNLAQIDDLYHAAVNGKGEYYSANSTRELRESLEQAVNDIKADLGSGANVSFNTGTLSDGALMYSAQFTSQEWVGTVRAEALSKSGHVASLKWDAATQLNARNLDTDPRLILTYNGGGVPFVWSNLSTDQRADLKVGGDDALGQARLSYLAGKHLTGSGSVEFRKRVSRLGDIINSAPVYVGLPAMRWPDADPFGADLKRYSAFRSDKSGRNKVVYVGANDGMLHGFDGETGREVLAYIPSFVYSSTPGQGLHALSQKNYDHRSYVDLPLAVSDVFLDSSWKTVLIGGARANAKGLFALDVTDPTQFTEANAGNIPLWEFTAADAGGHLGHLTGEVQVALLDWSGAGDYRWSAVFANGYGASSGKNGVFVLDIGKPKGTAWAAGSNYVFIELASGSGLSPVRLVDHKTYDGSAGSDGIPDRLYAGDTEGRLWAVNMTGGKSGWTSVYGGSPLFFARDSGGAIQPITAAPIVAYNKYAAESDPPNLLVLFGTGRYLSGGDVSSVQVQSFYGVHDRGVSSLNRASHLVDRDLKQQTITVAATSTPVRKTEDLVIDWADKYGWFVDFDIEVGERIVTGAQVRGDYVVFPTVVPGTATACEGGGSSWLMAIRLDGSTGKKPVLDVTRDGKLTDEDGGWAGLAYKQAILLNVSFIGDVLIGAASDTGKPPFLTDFGALVPTARISWRELSTD